MADLETPLETSVETPVETPFETPEEDAVEQQQQTVAEGQNAVSAPPKWDADEGDVAESSLEVPLDDDEYR